MEPLEQTMNPQDIVKPTPLDKLAQAEAEEIYDLIPEPESPAGPSEKLTRKQLGQLRRQYMTITHGRVKACDHLARFSKDHDPKNNCIHCWEAYFLTSVDLDFIHTVLTQKGGKALVAIKGTKFTKMFHGFLSSKMLPMLQAEINKTNAAELPAQIVGGTFGNNTAGNEVQTTSIAE